MDHSIKRDMKLSIDLTIKMACDGKKMHPTCILLPRCHTTRLTQHLVFATDIGPDFVDVAGNVSNIANDLQLDPAHFELSPNQLVSV